MRKHVAFPRGVSPRPVPFVDKAKERGDPELESGIGRAVKFIIVRGTLRVRVYFFLSRKRHLWATVRTLHFDFSATRLDQP